MIFNAHSDLAGKHSFMSPSSWTWLNDDEDKLLDRYGAKYATTAGTILHDVARARIFHRIKMSKGDKKSVFVTLLERGVPRAVADGYLDFDLIFDTLILYVNDAIGYKMTPEVILCYSDYCFGTADSISFRDDILRVHDFKSGMTPAKIEQLMVYAALFCLEYRKRPKDIHTELRIYQCREALIHEPDPSDIDDVMKIIIRDSKLLDEHFGMGV